MTFLLCVHMNIVFLLLYLHIAVGVLEKSDLDMVASELDAVASKWYTLGQNLLTGRDLNSIHTQNPKIGLRKVLSERTGYYLYGLTWKDIIEGVRSSGDSQLADHLETKYCSSEFTTT